MTTKYQISNHFTEEQINTIKELIKVSKFSVSLNIISPSEKNKYLSAKNKSELYDYAKSKDIEIQKLKEEFCEKLKLMKEKIKELEEDCKVLNEDILSLTKEHKEREKYITKLENENEDKCEELCNFDDIEINLKEEIKKLKENIKIYEGNCDFISIEELEEQIERLKEKNEKNEKLNEINEESLKDTIQELKKENEKLNIRIKRREKTIKEYEKKSKSPEKKISHSQIDCETGLQY